MLFTTAGRIGIVLLALALPALADTQFAVRAMTRDDVPRGKGQCDIRLQVDDQVEVSVRGDSVFIHTISGREARDDGSECNAPLPHRDPVGFLFDVKEKRNEIRLVSPPDRRNDFAAVVYIRDSDSGFGRYHFRLSWDLAATSALHTGGPFVANNATSYHARGAGAALYNDSDSRRLLDATVDLDRANHIQVLFKTERGRPIIFTGTVVAREGGRLKADVASEDGRLRGPMYLVLDDRANVNNVALDATDGRDSVQVKWERK